MFYRLVSVQRSLLLDFVRAYFGEDRVRVGYPIVSRRLLQRLDQVRLPAEPIERQLGLWFHALYARPPRGVVLGEAPVLLLCILHNLLVLCQPPARQPVRLHRLCRRRTEAMIAALPAARDGESATVYHAVLHRFEPFLARAAQRFEVQLGLEQTVAKSPLTALLWMEHLGKPSFDGLGTLLRDRELARFALLTIVEKEHGVAELHLPRVREAIRAVERLDSTGLLSDLGLLRELEQLREVYSGRRSARL